MTRKQVEELVIEFGVDPIAYADRDIPYNLIIELVENILKRVERDAYLEGYADATEWHNIIG